MSRTEIEWTQRPGTIGETWNPTTGCNKVDRGCKNCYAETMHRRLQAMGNPKYQLDFLKGAMMHADTLRIPYKWTTPRTVFVNSMSDLFHENVTWEFITDVFTIMEDTPQHTYLVLTKRPEEALDYWIDRISQQPGWSPPPNLWMGTSANDQASAEKRIPKLLGLAGVLRFLSYEPATGPINLMRLGTGNVTMNALTGVIHVSHETKGVGNQLDWVIAGGESGPKAVASDPEWFRQVRDHCEVTDTPYFFKQFGLWHPISTVDMQPGKHYSITRYTNGREAMVKMKDKGFNQLDGKIYQEFPKTTTT